MPVSVPDLLKGIGLSEESVDRVRLSRGVVGRTTYAVIIVLLVMAVAATRAGQESLLWICLIAAVIFIVYFAGILIFANRNPAAALLEGAEFVQWRQMEIAAKNAGAIPPGPSVPAPLLLPDEHSAEGNK